MSRIKGKNTAPELRLRKELWARGLRYRVNAKTPVGRPDLVFKGPRLTVFVDGCFWHGCPEHYVRPRSREEFWAEKLRTNVERDQEQTRLLEEAGWTVLRFWEHEVWEDLGAVVEAVETAVTGEDSVSGGTKERVIRAVPLNDLGSRERRTLTRLRDPEHLSEVEVERSTRKWRRPSE